MDDGFHAMMTRLLHEGQLSGQSKNKVRWLEERLCWIDVDKNIDGEDGEGMTNGNARSAYKKVRNFFTATNQKKVADKDDDDDARMEESIRHFNGCLIVVS